MSKCIINVCNIFCLYLRCVTIVAVGTSDEEGTPVWAVTVLRSSLEVMGFTSELFNEALINDALVLCFLVLFSCVV